VQNNLPTDEIGVQKEQSAMVREPVQRGRRRLSSKLCKTVCLCMTPSLLEKMRALGGSKWVRKVISEADVSRDALSGGRKRWSPDVYVERQCVTMPEEFRDKLRALGGSPWIRQRVIESDPLRDGI